jgi:hypothetical protein
VVVDGFLDGFLNNNLLDGKHENTYQGALLRQSRRVDGDKGRVSWQQVKPLQSVALQCSQWVGCP